MKKREVLAQIFAKIEAAESIVIFGHVNPDGDCVGSVMGLKKELQFLFPDKKIYGVGSRPSYLPSFLEPADEVNEEVISHSLAVLVDLNTISRAEDKRVSLALDRVCFDHHILKEDPGFLVYHEEKAPSATYVITKIFREHYHRISPEAATYFFLGLITDTANFQLDAKPSTLRMAAYLVSLGVDYRSIFNDLYRQSQKELLFRSSLYQKIQFSGRVAYAILRKADYEPYSIPPAEVGEKVDLLSRIDHHPIWVLFSENADGSVRVEYRSDGSYNMQKVASMFGGGGHFSASGCPQKDFSKVEEILVALNALPLEKEA